MVTSSSSFTGSSSMPSSPSTPSTDDTRSSSDDMLGVTGVPSSSGSSDLMDRVVRGAHETVDKLADKAKPQIQRLQDGAESASDSVYARVDQAREMTDEWAETLRTTVRENPLAAVGAALVLGLILARLAR